MMHAKRVIFMIVPLLFVPLVYGISSTPDVCALAPRPGWQNSQTCAAPTTNPETGVTKQTCCWTESERNTGKLPSATTTVNYCQTCSTSPDDKLGNIDCDAPVRQITAQQPTPPPTTPFAPPRGGGILQQPETSPTPPPEDDQSDDGPGPFTGPTGPLGGGVLEQPEAEEQEEEPQDEGQEEPDGQEESSEGAETAGPLT